MPPNAKKDKQNVKQKYYKFSEHSYKIR